MKFRISYLILAGLLFSLVLNGLDFTHHAHNSWLYYQMISNFDYMDTDPYFSSQITYAYGVPAYALAGLFWFVFSVHSVNILMGLTLIINYITLMKLFKNNERWISGLLLLNVFFTIFDAYVAAFSNCLFWLAIYAYFNKKTWWSIPLIIAAINHPYVFVSSLFFAVQTPALLVPLSVILTYFILASEIFTSNIFIPIYTIFMLVIRVAVNLMPIMALSSIKKIKLHDFKIVETLSNIRMKLPTLLVVVFIVGTIGLTLSFYTLSYQPVNIVSFTMFEGIPPVNGTVRVVDYLYLPSVYILPYYNYTLEAGSFRENNPQHMIKLTWNNISEYSGFLNQHNISYVLFCKMCNPQSNEKDMLANFELVWDNEYYYLYKAD